MHPKFPNNAMHLQYPGDLPNAVVKKLYSLNARLVKHVGITFGLTHSEFIVNDKGVYFIEIANRGGGVNTSNKIIPAVTGIDICELLIRAACGELVSVTNFTPYCWKKYAFLHFFDFGIGKVRSIKNVEKVSQLNGVLVVRLNIKVGEHLGFIKTAVNRPGFVILVGETVDQCKALLKEVYDTIHVEVEHELK
jgi:biotin carboxylase